MRALPETLATFAQPDWEYYTDSRDPDSATHRGIDAITRHFAGWFEAYPDLRTEPVEAKASGDRVFIWLHFSGHGAKSEVPIEMKTGVGHHHAGQQSGREPLSMRTRPKPSRPPG